MATNTISKIVVVYGGELAKDVAEQIVAKSPSSSLPMTIQNASSRPKNLLADFDDPTVLIVFVLQTVENAAPTEDGGTCLRFFKRKTHPVDLLQGKFQFTVFGLGDSNLLLDRQTTTAKDCNQAAQELDSRLEALGGLRFYDLGLADERNELVDVEPWISGLWGTIQGSK